MENTATNTTNVTRTFNLTADQILSLYPILNKLGEAELSLKLAINVASILDAFAKPIEVINQRRQKVIEDFAQREDNGEIKYVDKEKGAIAIAKPEEFNIKFSEFLSEEVEVEFKPLNLEALKDEDIKITAKDYLLLQDIFEKFSSSENETKE